MEAGSACPVVLLYSTRSWQAAGDRFVRESVMEQPFPTTDETTFNNGCDTIWRSTKSYNRSGSFIFQCLCHVIIALRQPQSLVN